MFSRSFSTGTTTEMSHSGVVRTRYPGATTPNASHRKPLSDGIDGDQPGAKLCNGDMISFRRYGRPPKPTLGRIPVTLANVATNSGNRQTRRTRKSVGVT